jgi:hypothetical protein
MLTRGIVAAHRAQQAGVPVLGNYNNKLTVMSRAKIMLNIIRLVSTRIFSNRPAGYIFFYSHNVFLSSPWCPGEFGCSWGAVVTTND